MKSFKLQLAMVPLLAVGLFFGGFSMAAFAQQPLYIIVPWGALHLPEIERAIRERGFELVSSDKPRFVYWSHVAAALCRRNFSGSAIS